MKDVLISGPTGKSTRTCKFLATAGFLVLAFACGTGAAAFAGLLPASKGVATAVTAIPLIDVQVDATVSPHHHHAVNVNRHVLRPETA